MRRLPDGRVEWEAPADVPPVAMSVGSTGWNRTGTWRSREPRFRDLTPPCAGACPAGQDVVDQVRLVAQGRVREAAELLLSVNPFPAVTGRVCPHPCVAACNRGRLDGPVDVPGVERAIGDALLREGLAGPAARARLGARVAVVGAGPAGLTAAHRLAVAGCEVTLHAREDRPGGLLRTGIPPYRLPRAVLDGEIARALAPGVRFEGGRALGAGLELAALRREADAVLLAIGRHAARRLEIPGERAAGVVDGVKLLEALHRGEAPPRGRAAVVVGGGNTAIDCARSLLRHGFQATLAYRRELADMPAFTDEVQEALEEGVRLVELALPLAVEEEGGCARAVRFQRARPGPPDASGRRRPDPIPGKTLTLRADLVVVAAGEELDREALPPSLYVKGAIPVDAALATPLEGVFACGDCAGGAGTVSAAIGEGRRAADAVLRRLGAGEPPPDPVAARGAEPGLAGFEVVRPAWFPPAAPQVRGRVSPAARRAFDEVRRGFSTDAARAEAARCLSCGTCTGCDNCWNLCADLAIVRLEPGRYAVDRERCKGCGVCVEECPRGAVELRPLGGTDGE